MNRGVVFCGLGALLGAAVASQIVQRVPSLRFPPTMAAPVDQTPIGMRSANPRIASVPPVNLTPEEQANIYVYEQANRSVVNINTRSVHHDAFLMLQSEAQGIGSGSILDKEGHILTNYHVVEDAQQVDVTLASGKTYSAQLVGKDKTDDIAVLKIDAPADDLYPVVWGDSSNLKVGQRVYAIGNPFGWDRTLTTGIVSSLNRSLPSRARHRTMKALIQTDAAMNPGNSGGPLLDTQARVIGMNVAIATQVGQNAGVGFAIPANRIQRMVPVLIAQGKFTRADIGIESVGETPQGLVVFKVTPGGPADRAGLQGFRMVVRQYQRGYTMYEERRIDRDHADMILAVDQQPVQTVEKFLELVEAHQPNEIAHLTILRAGRKMELDVKLGAS
ncbi:MAG: trypsin-like peptidase domain-containing protein [Pirellulales bacterium]|nr:trypsin-like peptidase domain-containing protein [Pirellulales bacterium]